MGWGEPHTPKTVDPEYPNIRAGLVERGLAIDRARLVAVMDLLGIDQQDTVAALHIDHLQVTVIRQSTVRRRIPGQGLNGPATFHEHVRQTRQHIPIINLEEGP